MECQACSDALTAFLDQELAEAESQEVEAHLAQCSRCRGEHSSLLYASQLVDSLPEFDLPPPGWEQVESQIRGSKPRFFDFQRFFGSMWAPAPIAVAVLILFSVPFYISSQAERTTMERRLATYVESRDAEEQGHQDLIENGGASSLAQNPFAVPFRSQGNNPFSTE